MNNSQSNSGGNCGGRFTQKIVSQNPVYSKKTKVYRPNKNALNQKQKNPKFL
jgi:hypothetical protein